MKRLFLLLTLTAVALTALSCASAAALTKDEAKDEVLEHAGVRADDAERMRIEYDVDGRAKKYEVEFYVDGDEYEYEIDADTGEMLKAEKNDVSLLSPAPTEPRPTEVKATEPSSNEVKATGSEVTEPKGSAPQSVEPDPSDAIIGADEAKNIALRDACASEADIRDLDIELERERGALVYEVDFDLERREYSYDIDAVTGEILDKRIETDD